MRGAEALLHTLADSGVEVCFANPGTSEMHFVAALDAVPRMRPVLGLFEGVATGAADGYGRMAAGPAATLLHLGPGLANGLANLHNARRARTPLVNVVGDHALHHKQYDPPLETDIDAAARTVSGWVHRSTSAAAVGVDTAQAVATATAPPGQVATLILPADVSWSDGASSAAAPPPKRVPAVADAVMDEVAAVLRSGEPTVVLLGGGACRAAGLRAASRIGAATGARVLVETFCARHRRGADLPAFDALAYPPETAAEQLATARHVVLAGAASPVSFFAYPERPSHPLPPGTQVHVLATHTHDVEAALEALADELPPGAPPVPHQPARSNPTAGPLTVQSLAAVVAATLPEDAIVSDEANTAGPFLWAATAGAPRHDWLRLTGGAIGQGLPVAVGAAVACPDRPVVCLEADGSAMYTISALWTMAREQLDVTTVVLSNRSYAILRAEMQRVRAGEIGPQAAALLDLDRPELDFVAIAAGMGVPAGRATTAAELRERLVDALTEPGPHLIEAVLPGSASGRQ
jgi:acetolactate synthase I/II/III large subunit